ncbi:MAG: dCTP deaminase [Bdellovibrionaceae bacterium]|nr:dCTP deaminase [Pseudobdellovibrionaceae bacterium]
MILTDLQILEEMKNKHIVIEPFRPECMGTNSYYVHLGKTLATYRDKILDAKKELEIDCFEIPDSGFVLQPDELYLGVTEEYTETWKHVPFLEGKSSAGRLGIDIHATAGKGDVGFANHWTLEISVKRPVRVYAGMPIGQLIYFEVQGEIRTLYSEKKSAKYNERNTGPVPSHMWKNFDQGLAF